MAVLSCAPTSDIEFTVTWTGTTGSRYTVVDDYPDTGGADFLTGGTTAGRITFAYDASSIPAGSTINSVTVRQTMRKNGTQTSAARMAIRINTTSYQSASINPVNGTFTEYNNVWTTNPATGAAWTLDQVKGIGANAIVGFGPLLVDASPTVDVSAVRLDIDYTPPAVSNPRAYAMFLG
jgi:hypothetical protein